jgi:hypothetical protein
LATSEFRWPRTARDTVDLSNRLSKWFKRAGVTDEERRVTLSLGLADSLTAAVSVANAVEELLATDPTTVEGASASMRSAFAIETWLFGEIKDRIMELEECWESELITRLRERLPPDSEDDDSEPAV